MKRIHRYLVLLIAGLIPLTMAFGQEKKNEQKIKIVIDEGSGEKILIDTVYSGDSLPRTIELKNGKVIVLDSKSDGLTHFSTGDDGERVYVTVTSDQDGEKKVAKTITVVSGDDIQAKTGAGKGSVFVVAKDGIVVTVESDDEAKAKEIIEMIQKKLDVKVDTEGDVKGDTKGDVKGDKEVKKLSK